MSVIQKSHEIKVDILKSHEHLHLLLVFVIRCCHTRKQA